ncbi:MAG: D-alanyl-D-alanine carboxypeptidase [Ruminococcaceae bacterium]|nr:D-alanyl-D-alanine carboxypeptidase [Oscillospiraceae bacterium]
MSENFYNKDYGDYFRELERKNETAEQINKPKETYPPKERSSAVKRQAVSRKMLAFTAVFIALIITVISVALVLDGANDPAVEDTKNNPANTTTPVIKNPYTPAKITAATKDPGEAIGSKHIIMVDLKTNNAILARSHNERTSPASTTKIMTVLVAAENITDYTETFTMTREITDKAYLAEATAAGFSVGEQVTMTDLLYGTILPSGADAALGLAYKIAGSEETFVKLMNKKVKDLGLKNTNFTNVTGLYDKNHYSTVSDMAVILKAAMNNEICRQVLMAHPYTTAKNNYHPEGITLQSTLFSSMYGTEPQTATIIGGKTGFVNQSGFCIASFGFANDSKNEYICVTFGAASKWPSVNDQINLYSTYAK